MLINERETTVHSAWKLKKNTQYDLSFIITVCHRSRGRDVTIDSCCQSRLIVAGFVNTRESLSHIIEARREPDYMYIFLVLVAD